MENLKPTALILGGTNPHIALIKRLRTMGYRAILIDYYENPPAKEWADEHIRESTLDKDKVLAIAKDVKAELVISTCLDQANVTASYVAEQLGLPMPYTYQTALNVSNKSRMKSIMLKVGIPTARFTYINKLQEIHGLEINFPVVVKPSDSNGSKGVRKATTSEELGRFVDDAMKISRTNTAIIEDYYTGKEIQIDCVVCEKKPIILTVRERLRINESSSHVLQTYGSLTPANISKKALKRIQVVTQSIVDSFELNNTPLFIQAMVDNDEINVIEFAPRVGGGLSYKLIKSITGLDMIDVSIDSYMGKVLTVSPSICNDIYLTNIVYASQGVFSKVVGLDELIQRGVLEDYSIYKMKGSVIGSNLEGSDRIGAYIIKAKTIDELNCKMKEALSIIDVLDPSDHSMIRKDVYKFVDHRY